MNAKERAIEIYAQWLHLATNDGRKFRKTVREQLMAETSCSGAAASTHYNNCKKSGPAVVGLGRPPVPVGARKMGGAKPKPGVPEVDDNDCFSVIELIPDGNGHSVGRCQAFIMQGDASETFDSKVSAWPRSIWILIQGLGPNHGDPFKLDTGEKEIKRWPKATVSLIMDPTVMSNVPDELAEEDMFEEEEVLDGCS